MDLLHFLTPLSLLISLLAPRTSGEAAPHGCNHFAFCASTVPRSARLLLMPTLSIRTARPPNGLFMVTNDRSGGGGEVSSGGQKRKAYVTRSYLDIVEGRGKGEGVALTNSKRKRVFSLLMKLRDTLVGLFRKPIVQSKSTSGLNRGPAPQAPSISQPAPTDSGAKGDQASNRLLQLMEGYTRRHTGGQLLSQPSQTGLSRA